MKIPDDYKGVELGPFTAAQNVTVKEARIASKADDFTAEGRWAALKMPPSDDVLWGWHFVKEETSVHVPKGMVLVVKSAQ